MQVIQVMTRNPQTVTPGDSVQTAARLMDELNVGVLPVCEGDKLVGMLTDRDIVVRSTSAGQDPAGTQVGAVMSVDVQSCFADSAVEEAVEMMQSLQVRRIPVVDGDRRLVGIVSLGDLAEEEPDMASKALEEISIPARPDR